MRKFAAGLAGTLASTLMIGSLLAAPAGADWRRPQRPAGTITDIVAASGGEFDGNRYDYDMLLNAVKAAGLAETLATPGLDVTVWAPNDRAFVRLARDLGYEASDEGGAFMYIVGQLTALGNGDPIPVLTAVLTYHVTPGAKGVRTVLRSTTFDTLQGGQLQRRGLNLVDADPDFKDARLTWPLNVKASNGVIHTINRVMLPIDI